MNEHSSCVDKGCLAAVCVCLFLKTNFAHTITEYIPLCNPEIERKTAGLGGANAVLPLVAREATASSAIVSISVLTNTAQQGAVV